MDFKSSALLFFPEEMAPLLISHHSTWFLTGNGTANKLYKVDCRVVVDNEYTCLRCEGFEVWSKTKHIERFGGPIRDGIRFAEWLSTLSTLAYDAKDSRFDQRQTYWTLWWTNQRLPQYCRVKCLDRLLRSLAMRMIWGSICDQRINRQISWSSQREPEWRSGCRQWVYLLHMRKVRGSIPTMDTLYLHTCIINSAKNWSMYQIIIQPIHQSTNWLMNQINASINQQTQVCKVRFPSVLVYKCVERTLEIF
jgi:hypothetical protein